MKNKFLSLALIIFGALSFQSAIAAETCSTQTRSAYDNEGNILFSATCTRCDEEPVVARVMASECANNALKTMIGDEGDGPLNP